MFFYNKKYIVNLVKLIRLTKNIEMIEADKMLNSLLRSGFLFSIVHVVEQCVNHKINGFVHVNTEFC